MNAEQLKDLFDIFRKSEIIEVEDLADYQVALLDTEEPMQAAGAVTALTLYQLEHGYDRGRFQMIQWAMSTRCADIIQARAIVGLLLICARQKIRDPWVLEQMADVLSYHNEFAYEAWIAILQSTKPEQYDPNFEVVKALYDTQLFANHPNMYFELFDRGVVEELDDFEWKLAEMFFKTMNLCDSDMFAIMLLLKQYMPAIANQLKEEDIDLDALDNVDIKFQQMMMISNGKSQLQPLGEELTETENYVQQLYRFMKLSKSTPLRVSDSMAALRNTMIDRMIAVGIERQKELENL